MKKKISQVLEEVLSLVKPKDKEIKALRGFAKDFLKKFNSQLKFLRIDAQVFVGGSFAKKTVIKKNCYDVDIFVRFDKQYKDSDISKLTSKVLSSFAKDFKVIHGSRDYFQIKADDYFYLEIIPVIKIATPQDTGNITDLSYFHVKYANKNFKSQRVLDDIKIAKAFCHATGCYGAESYIGGFSGYALEILIYHYGSFTKFLREILKCSKDKIVIDAAGHYKNRSEALMDINSSKLNSPIVLVDPTYRHRNALAALTDETFSEFQKQAKKFLKNPGVKFFDIQKPDLEKIKSKAEENKFEFILLEAKTNKQEGDVAGTKLLKFYKYLAVEISKYFEIKKKGFDYGHGKSARYFFAVQAKKEILHDGPFAKDSLNVKKFKKEHKKIFKKGLKVYAREKIDFGIKEFIKNWKKNKKILLEMKIDNLRIV